MISKTVKMVTPTSEIIVENIEEYVTGFSYMYYRLIDGTTQSFDRQNILSAHRRLPTGEWRQVHLKKVKQYPQEELFLE